MRKGGVICASLHSLRAPLEGTAAKRTQGKGEGGGEGRTHTVFKEGGGVKLKRVQEGWETQTHGGRKRGRAPS